MLRDNLIGGPVDAAAANEVQLHWGGGIVFEPHGLSDIARTHSCAFSFAVFWGGSTKFQKSTRLRNFVCSLPLAVRRYACAPSYSANILYFWNLLCFPLIGFVLRPVRVLRLPLCKGGCTFGAVVGFSGVDGRA
jgi:hypothetical protein